MAIIKTKHAEVYPLLKVDYPKNPNRMWAFPLLGGLAKIVILIPVFIEIWFISIFDIFIVIINSFIVFFTGKYWQYCFDLNFGLMKLIAKLTFFFGGITDKYPGFDFQASGFSLSLNSPKEPNKAFAFPIFGGLARILLLIPFAIFYTIINNAARIGIIISSIPVFFSGKYPEATYELTVDATRLSFASLSYFIGLKDNYPSFQINMNHKTLKMVLIIIAALFLILQFIRGSLFQNRNHNIYDYPSYQNNQYRQPPKMQFN